MGSLDRNLRVAVLAALAELLADRTVLLLGNAANSDHLASFFTASSAAAVHRLPLPATGSVADRMAALERALTEPTASLTQQLDAIDPSGHALVYAGSFTSASTVCGRRIIGSRSPIHFAAERKDVQARLLNRRVELFQVASDTIVEVADAMATALAQGPVMVQGIPTAVLAIGASHTYAVPPSASGASITRLLTQIAADCTAAILAPIDRGMPCTYYGFVTPTDVIDFGPFEALVFWNPQSWRIHAPGIARPITLNHENICRSRVHVTLQLLQQQTGYSGAFGTDGTATDHEYVIHEVNPRVCAGFAVLDRLCDRPVPLITTDVALRENPTAAQRLMGPLRGLAEDLRSRHEPLVRLWTEPPATNNAFGRVPSPRLPTTGALRKPTHLGGLVPIADLT